jgi:hypothetical protein
MRQTSSQWCFHRRRIDAPRQPGRPHGLPRACGPRNDGSRDQGSLIPDRRPNKCRLRRRECELGCHDHCSCAAAGGKPPFPPNAPARFSWPATRLGGLAFSLPLMSSQGRWKIKTLRGAAPQTPRQGKDSPAPAIRDQMSGIRDQKFMGASRRGGGKTMRPPTPSRRQSRR